MRSLVLVGALALAACDDPQVASGVAAALEHGSVLASVQCAYEDTTTIIAPRVSIYEATKYRDGSCQALLISNGGIDGLQFTRRSDAEADGCPVRWYYNSTLTQYLSAIVEDGVVLVSDHTLVSPQTVDIETECTGFNLEAFGVD